MAVAGDWRRESEGAVLGDDAVVAAVVEQLEAVVGERLVGRRRSFAEEADNVAADAIGDGRANDRQQW